MPATTVIAIATRMWASSLTDSGALSQNVEAGLLPKRISNVSACWAARAAGRAMTFPNGDIVSIGIDGEPPPPSWFGQRLTALDCTVATKTTYPHPPLQAATARDYTIQ